MTLKLSIFLQKTEDYNNLNFLCEHWDQITLVPSRNSSATLSGWLESSPSAKRCIRFGSRRRQRALSAITGKRLAQVGNEVLEAPGRRSSKPSDDRYRAPQRDIPVSKNAPMPAGEELPPPLQSLAYGNAITAFDRILIFMVTWID
jgi:hypothetical protein